jgi:hypothetical protein
MHTFPLIATGVLLMSQGSIQVDALGWRNQKELQQGSVEVTQRSSAVQDARDLAIFQELGE